MKLSELLYDHEYKGQYKTEDIEVSEVVSDTRAMSRGCLFICLKGTRFDSHTLLDKISVGGCSAVIVEDGSPIPDTVTIPVFFVKSTRAALARAHSRFHKNPADGLIMIGVTGTNGKTSTATTLYTLLRAVGIRAGLIGTAECLYDDKIYTLPEDENGERLRTMTTPDPDILYPMLSMMKQAGITHVVMEVSSHSLVLEKVLPIHYRLGIFTNLSPEHMDFHGTMEAYKQAKANLFSQCDIGIFNCDDPSYTDVIKTASCRILRAGIGKEAEHRATDIELLGSRGILYSYRTPGICLRIRSPLPGTYSVYNTLLALSAAITLGISPIAAADALATQKAVTGRLEKLPLSPSENFSVFIDYAHTPKALKSLLTTVRSFRREGERIVLLFGCGGDRDKSKRAPMGQLAEELADKVILTADNSRREKTAAILADIRSGMREPERAQVIPSRRAAIEEAILSAQENDIILLVGKGHETYEITQNGVRPFDERKIVKEALEKRKNGDTIHEN